jgi:hypothetical protein
VRDLGWVLGVVRQLVQENSLKRALDVYADELAARGLLALLEQLQ